MPTPHSQFFPRFHICRRFVVVTCHNSCPMITTCPTNCCAWFYAHYYSDVRLALHLCRCDLTSSIDSIVMSTGNVLPTVHALCCRSSACLVINGDATSNGKWPRYEKIRTKIGAELRKDPKIAREVHQKDPNTGAKTQRGLYFEHQTTLAALHSTSTSYILL